MKTPESETLQVTEHRVKLPTRWLLAIVAAAFALGSWVMKIQTDLSHDHEMLHDLKRRADEMWGRK